ncbi:hypothetical protein DZ860_05580 [Vibrio sinensis]|uniref:Uncharacterized protein n=1 Tax=Vibrio sinensis TaxID=2302434 RepID=A0A3A6RAU7_9VIBR|nr:hypothetical protein [Vibrio sinensis]RJX73701.1 hypothetical protein DZ860_05580 [Vibrio sinensis]
MNETTVTESSVIQLDHSGWLLKLSPSSPESFELQYQGKIHYSGTMEVMNNGYIIPIANTHWHFRHKPNKLEQWGQVHHLETLSINMNYQFTDNELVIEYLARNTVPTRLDIRHIIHHHPHTIDKEPLLNAPPLWRHRRNGLPSDFLFKTEKTDFFREAFSAKQSIVLTKL